MNLPRLTSLACLLGAIVMPQLGSALELGDPAPALAIKDWIKGKPVDLAEGKDKNIYVIEFWATWCGPCRVSIPHLTEMQAKYEKQNVVFVGVSDETAAVIKPFVTKMGAKMDYVVAADKDRATFANYMGAFDEGGIPHAFVVDKKGNLVWHGHPMAGLDQVLDQVIAGTFDIQTAKNAAMAEEVLPQYFTIVASSTKSTPEGDRLGRQFLEYAASNSQLLDKVAWTIMTHPRIIHRDLDLALAASKKAYEITGGKDASIGDTYARALFDSGNKEQAIATQKQAIAICNEPDLKAAMVESLARYEGKTVEKAE